MKTHHLTIGYKHHPVLSDINVELLQGALTIIIGANGSGKSTLIRTLANLQRPLSGEVTINGTSISRLSPAAVAREVAIVLTERTGAGALTVAELVSVGRHPHSGLFGRLSDADREIVRQAIATVGLTHKADAHVADLSDGERQKAMIARALAQQTPVIIFDEPTSFLDVASRFEIIALLKQLSRTGKAILLSTHDTAAALASADQVWAIADGALHTGTPATLAPILNQVYPGVTYNPALNDFRPR